MAKLKPGDIVTLKTTGPKMVISAPFITDNGEVTWWSCMWFAPINWSDLRHEHFPACALVKAKKEED